MDILGQLLNAATSEGAAPAIDTGGLAARFGLSPDQANSAVAALLPAVLGGIKRAEQGGTLGQVADTANATAAPHEDAQAGNTVLGSIFGSRDVSRSVADSASQQTGIPAEILRAMLPIVAGLVAQQVARRMGGGAIGGIAGGILGSILGGQLTGQLGGAAPAPAPAAPQSTPAPAPASGPLGSLGGLASMLDRDHDGNPLDDILNMVRGRS